MAQILDPLPAKSSNPIICCYINATSQIQIAKISNIPNWYFERVVFPGQRLVFESVIGALMEVHTGALASSILSDTIPCDRLQINESPYSSICETKNSVARSVNLSPRLKSLSKSRQVLSRVD
ncbi:MAG: DUF1830 domain-containing protein [Trichodesmium sp. St16_bin4-tuft]|nr:DUF1830 domain-containing protein [Trichodesmium sp. St4_bin8_1]MDE5072535.1 DUF1830 domain-containing protein [Trichodesmium sp. St5_bin8]MDE5079807.1 DUF1830 domain-containing protein [Trichodesmium sp. St2_bin6]MDE5101129.1 DUF1830 domain-containing protein [Trichodesmium sp. St16_bin4-tuft]MDE5104485.1 DUF1830 domain-containing protein [Trichodesmium sp. St19_bin2]